MVVTAAQRCRPLLVARDSVAEAMGTAQHPCFPATARNRRPTCGGRSRAFVIPSLGQRRSKESDWTSPLICPGGSTWRSQRGVSRAEPDRPCACRGRGQRCDRPLIATVVPTRQRRPPRQDRLVQECRTESQVDADLSLLASEMEAICPELPR